MENCKFRQAKENLYVWADCLLDEASTMNLFDWGMIKVCLVSFGLLVGASFADFFKKLRPLLAIVFAVTWIYAAWRLVLPVLEELFGKD